ncbi:Ataxin-3 [Homalodisca vitripennis]|nr:Ataxin-3 [Homalodisca vitripennis]
MVMIVISFANFDIKNRVRLLDLAFLTTAFTTSDHMPDCPTRSKQEGSLCAQHCLNALLQGSYFTAVDLAALAQEMDEAERIRMAESGVDSEDYRRFLEQPSGNMDDSGYFSVQVISSALELWGLEMIPYNSTEPRAVAAQTNPAAGVSKLSFEGQNERSLEAGGPSTFTYIVLKGNVVMGTYTNNQKLKILW